MTLVSDEERGEARVARLVQGVDGVLPRLIAPWVFPEQPVHAAHECVVRRALYTLLCYTNNDVREQVRALRLRKSRADFDERRRLYDGALQDCRMLERFALRPGSVVHPTHTLLPAGFLDRKISWGKYAIPSGEWAEAAKARLPLVECGVHHPVYFFVDMETVPTWDPLDRVWRMVRLLTDAHLLTQLIRSALMPKARKVVWLHRLSCKLPSGKSKPPGYTFGLHIVTDVACEDVKQVAATQQRLLGAFERLFGRDPSVHHPDMMTVDRDGAKSGLRAPGACKYAAVPLAGVHGGAEVYVATGLEYGSQAWFVAEGAAPKRATGYLGILTTREADVAVGLGDGWGVLLAKPERGKRAREGEERAAAVVPAEVPESRETREEGVAAAAAVAPVGWKAGVPVLAADGGWRVPFWTKAGACFVHRGVQHGGAVLAPNAGIGAAVLAPACVACVRHGRVSWECRGSGGPSQRGGAAPAVVDIRRSIDAFTLTAW